MDPARHLTQKREKPRTEMSMFEDLPDDALSVILMMVLLSHGNDEETKWSSDTGLNIKPVRWLANASNELKLRILGYYGHHDTSHPLFVVRLLMFRIEMRVSIATDRYFFNKTTDMMYGLIDSTEFGEFHSPIKLKEYLPDFVRTIWPLELQGVPFGQIFTLNGGVNYDEFKQLEHSYLRVNNSKVPYKPLEQSTPTAYREYKPVKSSTLLWESISESYRRMYRETTPNWRVGCSDYVMHILQFQGEKFFQDTMCPFAYLLMPSEKVQTQRMREYVDRVFLCMKQEYNYEYVDTIEVSTEKGSEPSYIMVSKNVCRDGDCMLCNVMDNIECHCPMEQFCENAMCVLHDPYQLNSV